jgi:hypothetical protein
MKRSQTVFVLLLTTLCSNAGAQDILCNLLTNTTTYWPAPALGKPEYLKPITDPTFGTKITRIVGDPGTPIPNIPGSIWAAQQERHDYSKISVWNCDQTIMYLGRHYPNLWLDGNTYQPLFTRTKPSSYLLWSHTEPNVMYHTGSSGNCRLGKWNVVTNVDSELVDLRAYASCTFGEGEGNFSSDVTKAPVFGKRINDGKYVIFVVDIASKTKGPDIEAPTDFVNRVVFDNCTMSSKGNYLIVNYGNDLIKVHNAKDGTVVWSESQYGLPSHFDVQIDQNGDEVIAGVAKTAVSGIRSTGLIIKRKLSDGTITSLTTSGYASHTSGRNLKRPGWVFVTYQNRQMNDQYSPYYNEIAAVKLDGSRVERVCNLRVDKYLLPSDDQYYFESHGCPSPDGLRVIFASDWDKGAYPVQVYVADFRDRVIATSVHATAAALPGSEPSLIGNYPNPFNPTTKIEFRTATRQLVMLNVFDVLGKEVARIVKEELEAGSYQKTFDASHLNSGVYFYRLTAGAFVETRRMLLIK